jgi:hypothetical protein
MSNIYIIGDSHARNYMPAIKEEFSGDYSVHYMTMGYGCAFLPPDMASLKKYSKVHCTDYVENVSDFLLKNTKQGDIVFIGSRLDGRQWKQRRSTPHYINFIKKFASKLEPNNVSVVILDGTFAPRRSPEECIDYPWTAANYKKGCFHSVEKVKNAFAVFDNLAENAATDLSNLYYAPLRTGLCYNGLCGQKNFNNTPIWHDVGHITEAASKELAPLLHSILAKQQFYQK